MLTPFGKFCRKLRIDEGELLKDMATKLGVTSSYLSAVENGKRNVPHEWFNRISTTYDLTTEDQNALMQAIQDSQNAIKIDFEGFSKKDKNDFMALARGFTSLNQEDKNKIIEILQISQKRRGLNE